MHRLQNGGAEASMEWILAHMDDADLNDALPDPSAATPAPATATFSADPEGVAMLSSMGFTDRQVISQLTVDGNTPNPPMKLQ